LPQIHVGDTPLRLETLIRIDFQADTTKVNRTLLKAAEIETGPAGNANQCALSTPTGGSMSIGSVQFEGNPQVYYRITDRSQGPKNTESYVQSMAAVTN
jgi:hypothetical protein